jgi:aspartyl/asparaginyl beta-hydroxylase (cupin superfamily)
MTDAAPTAEADLAAHAAALVRNPRDLRALLGKGRALGALGREKEAVAAFDAALAVAPPFPSLPPALQAEVRHAYDTVAGWHGRRDAHLQEALRARLPDRLDSREGRRFRQSLDVMAGRRSIYRQQPHQYFFPEVPCIEFYETEDFPWLAAVVEATPAIRDEFLAAHAADSGFEPYIAYPDGRPLDQWAELNRNPRWSAFHLLKDGAPLAGNAERCPRTMAALAGAPQPHLHGRTPTAMFSLLKPRTRIPPHTGVTNARLVVHIPLVVPEACGFRVGGETREWRVGEPLIFDDSVEHEAWNNSDQPRCVLIFDIWNPFIGPEERDMIAALYDTLDAFEGGGGEGWS